MRTVRRVVPGCDGALAPLSPTTRPLTAVRLQQVRQAICINYQLRDHVAVCQSGLRPYSCPKCAATFTLRCNMLRHERLHADPVVHRCAVCNKTFKHKQNVQAHMLRMHGTADATAAQHGPPADSRGMPCDVCGKVLHKESALERHALMHVDGGRTFACQICQKRFTQMRYLTAHMVVHRDKQNVCPTCSRRFVHRSHLLSHINKVHFVSE